MKNLNNISFSLDKCLDELNEFKLLLSSKDELKERDEILPFFNRSKNISAFIAAEVPKMSKYDLISHEFPLYGEYQADLIIGDSSKRVFCFVEFENATRTSLFAKKSSSAYKFAPRFEAGYSQIVDWFKILDDQKRTDLTTSQFNGIVKDYYGILVIGRDKFIDKTLLERINWRSNNIIINSKSIYIYTYDMLYNILKEKLEIINVRRRKNDL